MMNGKELLDFVTGVVVLIIVLAVFVAAIAVMEMPNERRRKRG